MEIYMKLSLIEKDVVKKREGENGWKIISRSERERILKILNLLKFDLNNLIGLIN